MGEAYSNAPNDATEMLTKICSGDEHPFPIPSRVMEAVRGWRQIIHECWEGDTSTFHYGPYSYPALLGMWEDSLIRLKEVTAVLGRVCIDLNGPDGDLASVAAKALEREVQRQEAIFKWAWSTWRYDPVILGVGNEQEDPSPDDAGHKADADEAPAELQ